MEDGQEGQKNGNLTTDMKTAGENLLVVQGTQSAAKAKYCGEPDGRGTDEAAAKNEDHDRYDKRKPSQRAERTQTTVAGSVSCWPLILKKRGSDHDGQTLCCKGTNGCMK